jgi:hypothetical protein
MSVANTISNYDTVTITSAKFKKQNTPLVLKKYFFVQDRGLDPSQDNSDKKEVNMNLICPQIFSFVRSRQKQRKNFFLNFCLFVPGRLGDEPLIKLCLRKRSRRQKRKRPQPKLNGTKHFEKCKQ